MTIRENQSMIHYKTEVKEKISEFENNKNRK